MSAAAGVETGWEGNTGGPTLGIVGVGVKWHASVGPKTNETQKHTNKKLIAFVCGFIVSHEARPG